MQTTLILFLLLTVLLVSPAAAKDKTKKASKAKSEPKEEQPPHPEIDINATMMEDVNSTLIENETEEDEEEQARHKSMFESPCAYKNGTVFSEMFCEQIVLNSNYQVEVLLPVTVPSFREEIYVPFLVQHKRRITTFSRKALDLLNTEGEGASIEVVGKRIPANLGDENILGLDVLNDCLLAIDFFSFEAGMAVNTKNGTYSLNWPLESFKNAKLRKRMGKITKKYMRLTKAYDKQKHRHYDKVEALRDAIKERENILARLQARAAEARIKAQNQPQQPVVPNKDRNVKKEEDDDDEEENPEIAKEVEADMKAEYDDGEEMEEPVVVHASGAAQGNATQQTVRAK